MIRPIIAAVPMAALAAETVTKQDWVELVLAVLATVATWFLARKKEGRS